MIEERVTDLADMLDGCAAPFYFSMSDIAVAFGDNNNYMLEAMTANQLTEVGERLNYAMLHCTEQQYHGPLATELRKLMPDVEFSNEVWGAGAEGEDRVPPTGFLVTAKRDQLDDDRAAMNIWLVHTTEIID